MYTHNERESAFSSTIEKLKSSDLIEGIVQLGSGVIGYKDELSDIDLMLSTPTMEDVEKARGFIRQCFSSLHFIYIKEIQLRENIYLFIAFMENGLEFNVSILPTEKLNVKSPLWKVVVDKSGEVSGKMEIEHERFTTNLNKNDVGDDIPFEFFYSMRKLHTELKRNNVIYALKMLEIMRDDTLHIQAMNENKKLHQFKAYETLSPQFITRFLETYPSEFTSEAVLMASDRLRALFIETIKQNNVLSLDEEMLQILRY
ncbi:aminoglycoside 6-adenylyltransferase [Rossellomorea aquimaris]|uniref:Streptomycin adenylyltransferase n=1 Tax=Rossellomorea aquimaris TaxID=189382 RepID=A0A366EQ15_9BACI|nr:aminoglycoside 6-adenylyltransferase [Rossellomorea aquimaris]RBP03589.1 streptomycin adenylyltransferase [Rossellomorea aquimaris]